MNSRDYDFVCSFVILYLFVSVLVSDGHKLVTNQNYAKGVETFQPRMIVPAVSIVNTELRGRCQSYQCHPNMKTGSLLTPDLFTMRLNLLAPFTRHRTTSENVVDHVNDVGKTNPLIAGNIS